MAQKARPSAQLERKSLMFTFCEKEREREERERRSSLQTTVSANNNSSGYSVNNRLPRERVNLFMGAKSFEREFHHRAPLLRVAVYSPSCHIKGQETEGTRGDSGKDYTLLATDLIW